MKVGEVILRYLHKNDIKTIFGIPSGTTSPTVDAMNDFDKMEFIIPKNESAATFATCKAAKFSNKIQASIMSGAVGIPYGFNGIAEAYQSKAPMIVFSGYVSEDKQGKGGMQELEAHKYLDNVVKYNKVIKNQKNILKEVKKAMEIAMTHPRGPVHIGLPLNIQKEIFNGDINIDKIKIKSIKSDMKKLRETVDVINNIQDGIIMVGGGCRGLNSKIKTLAEKTNWKIITTASGKGIIEEGYKLNMGNFGFPGTDLANKNIQSDDIECVLVLGSQLGENATNNFSDVLSKDKKLIHIDADKKAFNKHYEEDICVLSELDFALDFIINNVDNKESIEEDLGALNYPYIQNHTGLSLRRVYELIPNYMPKDTIYMNDIGSTWVYAHKYLEIPSEGDYDCNSNHACMGSSSGFIGINRLNPDRPIALFTGDGSFYMSIMNELLTAKKYNMKVVFFVNNNSTLGYVSKGHESIFGRTLDHFNNPDVNISGIVNAMGIKSIKISSNEEINELENHLNDIDGPMVVELITNTSEPLPTNRFKALK